MLLHVLVLHPSLLMAIQYSLVSYSIFIHLLVNGHLGYFHFLTVISICVQVCVGMVSVLLGIYPGVELLGPKVIL